MAEPDNTDTNPERVAAYQNVLPDGHYEVLVVDVVINDGATSDSTPSDSVIGDHAEASLTIEVVITDGPRKGEVITVEFSAAVTETEALEALGIPGVLMVDQGQPQLQLEESQSPGPQA